MAASTKENNGSNYIVDNHAYSILRATEVDVEDTRVKLLQLRNQRGNRYSDHLEWNGDWSDRSTLWTPQLKQQLGWVDRKEGSFFINFEDFKKYYEVIELCWVNDNYTYSACPIELGVKGWAVVSVKLETDCDEVYVKVTQTDKR